MHKQSMIECQIATNKNYKKIFRNLFLYRKSKKLKKAQVLDLGKGRGCGSVLFTRKIEFEEIFFRLILQNNS